MKTVLTTHDKELTLFLPSFMALNTERRLSKLCEKGYRLVDVSPAILGYRFHFTCEVHQNRDFYVFSANEHRAAKAKVETAPGYVEEKRLLPLCKKVVISDGAIFVAELNLDADSNMIRKFSAEKMQSAMKHNILYFLLWLSLLLFAIVGSLLSTNQTAEYLISMYVGSILVAGILSYHVIAIAVCCRELLALQRTRNK